MIVWKESVSSEISAETGVRIAGDEVFAHITLMDMEDCDPFCGEGWKCSEAHAPCRAILARLHEEAAQRDAQLTLSVHRTDLHVSDHPNAAAAKNAAEKLVAALRVFESLSNEVVKNG